jgi:predicted phosphohydrolase
VVYGHLHGAGIKIGFEGEREGIQYHLVSCDALGFNPVQIMAE